MFFGSPEVVGREPGVTTLTQTIKSTGIYPADRAWDREGKGSPHVGVGVGGAGARAQHIEYSIVFYLFQGAGGIAGIWWALTRPTSWVEWSAFITGYLAINFGVGVGYHRYFTHRSFETSRPMQILLATLGQMASMGSLINWVADHRRHHAFANVKGDPYGPKIDGYGRPQSGFKAWAMSHLGWLHDNTYSEWDVYAKGVSEDPYLLFLHRTRYFWAVFSMVLLPAGWALAFGGPEHVLPTILIGGCLRCFLFSNSVAANNSLAHRWGYRLFDERSEARNNWFCAIISLGDGWHNAHHAQPRIASNKVKWWEFDFNGSTIHLMEKLGLAWDVRKRSKAELALTNKPFYTTPNQAAPDHYDDEYLVEPASAAEAKSGGLMFREDKVKAEPLVEAQPVREDEDA
jgi:stearoyl-CoA desaturase (delta-9 desaturase)